MKIFKRITFVFAVVLSLLLLVACKDDVIKHKVTFANTDLASVEVVDGEKVTKPTDPKKDGFEFVNWFAEATFDSLFSFDTLIKKDTTIYAKWNEVEEENEYKTIAEILAIGSSLEHNTLSDEKYYVKGTIKSISNTEWGNMIIEDETGEIGIYGLYAWDSEDKYNTLDPRPIIGDVIYVYSKLKKFNESVELNGAWFIKMEQGELPEFDVNDYTEKNIHDAKESPADSKVLVEGVVTRITYANGRKPNGFFLIDETGALYVHDYDIAVSVDEGDLVKIAGSRADFILETEIGFAQSHGYQGAIQLDRATLVEKVSSGNSYATDWIEETTIKELMDTNPREKNITGNIYKVNAFVNKVPGSGFTNYYFNDLDNYTGSYSYSMNNGGDFNWLDQYDGQLRTVYLAVINAKSTVSNVQYRFVPIEILDVYEYDQSFNAEYAVKFVGKDQFLSEYILSPDTELITSLNAAHLNIENVSLSYTSNNEDIVYFENVDGKLILKINEVQTKQTVKVTIKGEHGENTFTDEVTLTINPVPVFETISIADAILKDADTNVIVEGIVTASLVNKVGFYISDETGIIAVEMSQEQMSGLELGHLVVVSGNRNYAGRQIDDLGVITASGQSAIRSAEVVFNKYGNHEYNTDNFVTGKTLADLVTLDKTEDYTSTVYIIDVLVEYVDSGFFTRYSIKDPNSEATMNIYSSSGSQLRFLQPVQNKVVTAEFTVVNWNGKNWSGSLLSVTHDGVKIINDSNFR